MTAIEKAAHELEQATYQERQLWAEYTRLDEEMKGMDKPLKQAISKWCDANDRLKSLRLALAYLTSSEQPTQTVQTIQEAREAQEVA